jgi:hypothetical protein
MFSLLLLVVRKVIGEDCCVALLFILTHSSFSMSLSRSFLLFCFFLLLSLALFSPSVRSSSDSDDSVSDINESDDLAVSEDGEAESEADPDAEAVEIEEVLDDAGSLIGELEPHPDVQLSVFFPESVELHFPQDHDITALVAVHNVGPEAFNISYSGAHLHSAIDYSYYVQNVSLTLFPSCFFFFSFFDDSIQSSLLTTS